MSAWEIKFFGDRRAVILLLPAFPWGSLIFLGALLFFTNPVVAWGRDCDFIPPYRLALLGSAALIVINVGLVHTRLRGHSSTFRALRRLLLQRLWLLHLPILAAAALWFAVDAYRWKTPWTPYASDFLIAYAGSRYLWYLFACVLGVSWWRRLLRRDLCSLGFATDNELGRRALGIERIMTRIVFYPYALLAILMSIFSWILWLDESGRRQLWW